jgi:hypothetical protein
MIWPIARCPPDGRSLCLVSSAPAAVLSSTSKVEYGQILLRERLAPSRTARNAPEPQ